MPIYRKIAKMVRSQPLLWRTLHPTHDFMTQRLRELRVWREYSDRLSSSAFRGNLLVRDAIRERELLRQSARSVRSSRRY